MPSFMLDPAFIWLVLLVAFVVIESVTVSLVSVWFAAGALVALILAGFGLPVWVQIIAFLAAAIILLLATRPLLKRYLLPKTEKTNLDMIIGTEGLVEEDIDNLQGKGAVSVNGKIWTARSSSDSPIVSGKKVTIDRIEGVKLFVTEKQ